MTAVAESELLSPAEVKQLCDGKARPSDQVEALKALGIPCLVSGRRVIVSRYHLRQRLEGRPTVAPSGGPRLERIK